MRKKLGTAFIALGFVAAAAAAGYYAFFMWGLDWGPMVTRGHNLMLVLTLFGTVFVFLIVLLLFGYIAALIDPELGK